ncbi:MAG: oxidoreductase [Phycisphaerales bacterium]|nr:oxidoreductase [Phycisphaerales bacterium]MDB5300176.1 oxidoreductase [Phycisphaerales bacterium]
MPRQMMSPSTMLTLPISEDRDHILGPPNAPVTLVEYGDFECPYCGQAYWVLKELEAQMGDQTRMVFRHFPLTQIHPHAGRAAEAAEAAGAQGRFWEMHDMLYENQDALDDYDLVGYAQALGLDVRRFRAELLTGVYAPRVREDFLSGIRSGVNGTPTFFINGRRHDGPWDLDSLMAAIEPEIMKRSVKGGGRTGEQRTKARKIQVRQAPER